MNMLNQKKKNRLPIIIAAIAIVLVVIIIVSVVAGNSTQRRYDKQLSLAQHYLEELEYDQAIAAYKAAIEIDPSRPEAYLGLAEVYAALEKYGAAVAILERGAGQSKSDVITGKLEEMKVMMQQMQAAEVIEDEVVVATTESTDSQKEDESIVENQIEINETQENSDDNAIQENEQS